MRSQLLISTLLILLALVGWYVGWVLNGRMGFALAIVFLSPLIGIAAAPLVLPFFSNSIHTAKVIAYRSIEGSYYEYKGKPLKIVEDLVGDRWIQAQDIRRIISKFPRDQVLLRIVPDQVGRMDGNNNLLFLAQGLSRYLDRNQDETTIRFRNWLQREVIFPSQRARELGVARTASKTEPPRAAP